MNDRIAEDAVPRKGAKNSTKTRVAKTETGPVSLEWALAELPSSQHKAGLAGLALCVQYLQRTPLVDGVCEIETLDEDGLRIRVDRKGMQALFDLVYAASLEERESEKKFQKKTASGAKVDVQPKRTIERAVPDKKGIDKAKTFYVYEHTVPAGEIIDEWDESPGKLWLKLWRDLVWRTLRGVPATREPYERRAEKRVASDGEDAFDELTTKPCASVKLPSTYYIGAQERSAENVPFEDVARCRVLLHFWPFVIPIYVPAIMDRDGKSDFVGHVIVVPDVHDLAGFVANWDRVMRERDGAARGYVPRDSVIDLAAEAGLDVARRAFALIEKGKVKTQPWMEAVDVFHVEKEGNNVRIREVARIDLRRDRANDYGRVRERYWNALFRRRRIISILDENAPWWTGFGRLCATTTEELTINDSKFRHDCRLAFTEVEMDTATDIDEPTLEHLIYRATRSYVYGKLESKYGLTWQKVEGAGKAREDEYNDKKLKIARDAFLAVRSRTGADFIGYFTSTICSVPQRLGEQGYLMVARALHDEREVERIRSLTLLALSAA